VDTGFDLRGGRGLCQRGGGREKHERVNSWSISRILACFGSISIKIMLKMYPLVHKRQPIQNKKFNVRCALRLVLRVSCYAGHFVCMLLYKPFCHGTIKPDSVRLVCNILLIEHVFNLYYSLMACTCTCL